MRWFYAAITLSVLSGVAFFTYFHVQTRDLHAYCEALPRGQTIAEVRKFAQKNGFSPVLEPFAQMRIEPRGWWTDIKPTCRVFFNRARTVEYRIWQNS